MDRRQQPPLTRRQAVAIFESDLLGLYCRRLGAREPDDAQRSADRTAAIAALERALLCGAAHDRVLAVPGIGQVRDDPRFVALLGR